MLSYVSASTRSMGRSKIIVPAGRGRRGAAPNPAWTTGVRMLSWLA
jgi:hypothetical protein